jgi:hypothetical protein
MLRCMEKQRPIALGIDIGRVIISAARPGGRSDTSFLSGSEEVALSTPASEGAFEAIRDLVVAFEERVWLVSKCGPRIQKLTSRWFRKHRFHEITGVRQDRVRFCARRPDKREHCLAIGATHFVDDRLDVLEHLVDIVPNLYWFGHQTASSAAPIWARQTLDWFAARREILDQLEMKRTGT